MSHLTWLWIKMALAIAMSFTLFIAMLVWTTRRGLNPVQLIRRFWASAREEWRRTHDPRLIAEQVFLDRYRGAVIDLAIAGNDLADPGLNRVILPFETARQNLADILAGLDEAHRDILARFLRDKMLNGKVPLAAVRQWVDEEQKLISQQPLYAGQHVARSRRFAARHLLPPDHELNR